MRMRDTTGDQNTGENQIKQKYIQTVFIQIHKNLTSLIPWRISMESFLGDFGRNLQNFHLAVCVTSSIQGPINLPPYDNMACPSLRYKSQECTGMLFSVLLFQFLAHKIQSWWKPDGLSFYPVFAVLIIRKRNENAHGVNSRCPV